jgi:hypothetical protein
MLTRPRAVAQPILNGQRAAVCALVIAGVSLTLACKILHVPYRGLQATLPYGWHTRTATRRKWRGELLEQIHEAWMDKNQRVRTIAERHGISFRMVSFLAHREGWGKRRRGPRRSPVGLRAMKPAQLRWYNKMRPIIGREAALKHVWAGAQ